MPRQIVVLLAEDDELTRIVAAEALRDEGFEVIEAVHAEDALTSLKAKATAIHALFTDVQMPGAMDGLALAHHTARNWPWIVLLIASGVTLSEHGILPPNSRFLPKPYHPLHAINHIQEMMAI